MRLVRAATHKGGYWHRRRIGARWGMTFEARITKPDEIPISITMTMTRYEWNLVLRSLLGQSDYVATDVSTLLRAMLLDLDKETKLERELTRLTSAGTTQQS